MMTNTNIELVNELSIAVANLVGASTTKAAARALQSTRRAWLNGCEPNDDIRSLYTAVDILVTPRAVGGTADDVVRIKGLVFNQVQAQLESIVAA